ncbi:unnamed protein product [Cylicocyclus nassatus]|uniref:Uncharacterized protein n=1 Tax=Cylicocyclus nassatus TaxID=53992 RepID=A0AA36DT07_CYLNA|nr:unnamed protein product [Cylicocyclus nassatus]
MLFHWLLIILPIYSYGYFDGEHYYRKAREDPQWKTAFTQAFKLHCRDKPVDMVYDTSNLELLDNHVFYGTSDSSKYRIFNMHYNKQWSFYQTADAFFNNIGKEHIDLTKENTCDVRPAVHNN